METQTTPAHCLFQRGPAWFALPALSVREIMFRPKLVELPRSPPFLTGLCQVRSEYLAVVNLDMLPGEPVRSTELPDQMIVISGNTPWAILVDDVAGLTTLETSLARENAGGEWSGVVMGWSSYRGEAVRILDPSVFYSRIDEHLKRAWDQSLSSCA